MIKNLIPGLSEHGKIKAGKKGKEVVSSGGKKFRLPKKLDHYIITTTERDKNDDFIIDTALMESLKKSENTIMNKNGNIVGIPIQLLYNSIDLNFPTRYASYVAGKCTCSGDGEWAYTRDGRDIECPCERLDSGFLGKNKCKANGKLYAIIDGAESVGACHVLRTTSINTVKSIIGGLAFIQAASNGLLAFLPLHLILSPKSVTTPSGQQTTVYVSSIVYRGNFNQLRLQALEMAKEKAKYLLEMETVEEGARQLMATAVESEEEQAEVQKEFYPDAVDDEPSAKTKKLNQEVLKVFSEGKVTSEPESPEGKTEDSPQEQEVSPESGGNGGEAPDPITQDQKRQIVALKSKNEITNPDVWAELLKPWEVKSANFLDCSQADEFIEALKANPI